ncbi:ABC transporter permease [Bacillus sp. V3B]|uniref:ABC transporter permease n=1 Tax=Bacillus sp. V3B TaxID=2804915 RepID=UPI00210A7281|nr:ABC transporter permease [Bacillus sp. V3B]MCQ6275026.1 ABC transporter permease [Bacillus sp. V3B]
MIGILLAKCRMFIRNPWTFLLMTAMSLGFALVLGGSNQENTIQVPVYVEDEVILASVVGETIEESDVFAFKWMTEEELTEQIANGKAEVGVKLQENDFQLLVGVDSPNVAMIKQTIQGAYVEREQQERILQDGNFESVVEKEKMRENLETAMESPIFTIEKSNFKASDTFVYDSTLQSLFGFTLFFVIYTIAYNILPILSEKNEGVWDRMILSPLRKWEMYVANLIYSFVTGYLQVLIIFLIFHYEVGVDFNGNFVEVCLLIIPYVFSIVALSILITALVKNIQQFNAVLPIISVSSAMIGGAYWPLEIVESKLLLALSKINPLTYGIEVLNGVAIYGYPMEELLFPISILILMGVVMTGIGIHLMEKRHV